MRSPPTAAVDELSRNGSLNGASFGWVRVQDLLRVDASDAAVFMDTGGSVGAATVGEGEFPVFGMAEEFLR